MARHRKRRRYGAAEGSAESQITRIALGTALGVLALQWVQTLFPIVPLVPPSGGSQLYGYGRR